MSQEPYSSQQPPSPPGYPPPGYGSQPAGQLAVYQKTNNMAVLSLIMGILSFFALGCIGGILAIVFGNMATEQIRLSQGTETGDGMAKAGKILGWINIGLSILGILFGIVVILLMAGGLAIFGVSQQ